MISWKVPLSPQNRNCPVSEQISTVLAAPCGFARPGQHGGVQPLPAVGGQARAEGVGSCGRGRGLRGGQRGTGGHPRPRAVPTVPRRSLRAVEGMQEAAGRCWGAAGGWGVGTPRANLQPPAPHWVRSAGARERLSRSLEPLRCARAQGVLEGKDAELEQALARVTQLQGGCWARGVGGHGQQSLGCPNPSPSPGSP